MNRIDRITHMIKDARQAIGLASNPIPAYKDWLENAMASFENTDLEKIEKDIKDLLAYSKLLKDPKTLEVAFKNMGLAELHIAETYSVHQKYFFYTEVINYGILQDHILQAIKDKNLDIEKTLGELASQIHSEAYKKRFGAKKAETELPEEIVKKYAFLIKAQDAIYHINQNLVTVYKKAAEKHADIDKAYQQKAVLFQRYLDGTDYEKYRMGDKKVLYDKYVFAMDTGEVLELNDETGQAIGIVLNRGHFKMPAVLVREKLDELLAKEILTDKTFDKLPDYYRIFFEVTNECNLNCRYCFNRDFKRYFELEPRDWIYISDYLPKNSQVNLFGGEPFVKEGIEEILFKLDALLQNKKILEVRCFTNGVNTEKTLSILKKIKSRFWILISLDGVENKNDSIRGKGNFKRTIETIKRIKEETSHVVWVKSLVTNLNYDSMLEFVKILEGLNVDYFSLGELQLEGNAKGKEAELMSYEKEFALIDKIKQSGTKLKIKDEDILQDFLVNRCGYGHCLFYIRSDGFIGGCTENDQSAKHIFELYPNMQEFKKNPMKFVPDLFKTGMVDPNSKCFSCGYVNLCMGGCYARAIRSGSECDDFRAKKIEYLMKKIIKEHAL